jgi:hypothetical protein
MRRRYHYQANDQLAEHLTAFLEADNFAKPQNDTKSAMPEQTIRADSDTMREPYSRH